MLRRCSRSCFLSFIPVVISVLILSGGFVALAQTTVGQESTRASTNWVPQNPPVHFAKAVAYPSGGDWVYSVAVGDLNGDGHPDLVVANLCGNYSCYSYPWEPPGIGQMGVLIGNGDGTFQPTIAYISGGYDSYSVAIADVNGDGHPDLVVANLCENTDCNNGSVSVLLGNGDGTFQAPLSFSSGENAWAVAVADVNGDGKPDLVVGTCSFGSEFCNVGSVGVLLGNGDGTFQTVATYRSGGSYSASVVIGDLNGDGFPDLVVINGGVGVLLNNGDGTFRAAVTYGSGAFGPESVAIADVNGDRTPDLLVANCGGDSVACGSGTVGVLLGNGDGTFRPPVGYSSGAFAGMAIAVGDVNGDGHPDLAVAGGSGPNGKVGVLLGNDDGTFRVPITYSFGNVPDSIAIADLNGDGRPDLVVGDWGDFSVDALLNDFAAITTTKVTSSRNPSFIQEPVTFTAIVTATSSVPDGQFVAFYADKTAIGTGATTAGVATLTTPSLSARNHTIKAVYPGDAFHKGSSGAIGQVVNRYSTSTMFTSSLNPSIYGQTVTFAAKVTGSGPTAPTGHVTFSLGVSYSIGSPTLDSSGLATLTRSNLNANPYPLTAEYQGDATNAASSSTVLNQTVSQTTSAATITSSPNPSAVGQAVTFTATITSPTVTAKGPVTFTSGKTTLGTAQLTNGRATFATSSLPVGSDRVKVVYKGDSNIVGSSAVVTQVVQP